MPLKTTVITGATSGIGKATAFKLAAQGYAVYMLVRNIIKGDKIRQEIVENTGNNDVYIIKCDMADLQTVIEAANELSQKLFAINTLINNAGGIFADRQIGADSFEMTFTTNHLGHFLLTTQLMPLLQKGQARIINISSAAHKIGKPQFDDLQWAQSYSPFKAYGMNKLFNIYFAKSLAEKYASKGILSFSLHPGVVNTGFGEKLKGISKIILKMARPFILTPEQAAESVLYLVTTPQLDKFNGQYFRKNKPVKPSTIAESIDERNKLWAISEKLLNKITSS